MTRSTGGGGESREQVSFRLSGLSCADCAAHLEEAVASLEGVRQAWVHFGTARLTAEWDPQLLSREDIVTVVRSLGYRAQPEGEAGVEEQSALWRRRSRELLAGLAALGLLVGFLLSPFREPSGGSLLGFLVALLAGGVPIAWSGLRALRHGVVGMDLLMTLAVLGAMALREWTEAATVVCLFALAHLLEDYSVGRTRRAIRALMDQAPKEALVRRDGATQGVPVGEVPVGAQVVVKPGERIPLDGIVVEGHSTVDQSPITGESLPLDKGPGDPVFAGTINQRGSLEFEVTKTAPESTFARILHRIEEAQAQRAPSQQFVERFARYYTPAVIGIAALVACCPPVFFPEADFREWFYKGLVLLVIACPCALVISTPVAVVSGLAAAARHGVLIKGGLYLEEAGAARAVAFDKTGTLTVGQPEVIEAVPLDGSSPEELLAVAAAIEQRSEHPFAQAIERKARQIGLALPAATDFEALPGLGAKARIGGETYYVGGPRLFAELGAADGTAQSCLQQLAQQGQTAVLVGTESRTMGLIALADQVREGSREALQALRRMGLAPTVMLTGDNPQTAARIARETGVDEFRAGLLPEDKVAAIQELEARHGRVIMVGDGVNDAPALAVAHVGVAMGAAGTDMALETADIALMSDDLSRLPFTIDLGRRTQRIIRQNIAAALLIKALFIGLTFLGFTTLWMAVGADMGASLAVIANAMRLHRIRPAA